jgi:hypothetical protein
MIDPVVIPVRADVGQAQSAVQALGDTVRRARDTPGGPGAPAAEGAAQVASVRAVLREFQTMEATLRTVNQQLERLGRQLQVVPGGGQRPDPAVVGVPPAPGGGAGGGAVGAGGLPSDVRRLLQLLGTSAAGTLGIGFGLSAFGDVSRWITEARGFGGAAAVATLGGGGDFGGEYGVLERILLDRGRRSIVAPEDSARISAVLRRMGLSAGEAGGAAEMYGLAGVQAFGSAGAGVRFAETYQTLRTQQIPDHLATLVALGQVEGRNIGELLQQFGSLTGLVRSRQGQFERTGAELMGLLSLQAGLNRLPGGIGRGEGGVELARGLTAFGQGGGVESAIAMRAYMRSTGKGFPRTPDDWLDFEIWNDDPANALRKAEAIRGAVGNRAIATELLAPYVRRAVGRRLFNIPGPLTAEAIEGLTPEDRQALVGRTMAELSGTYGGEELLTEAGRRRAGAAPGVAAELAQFYRRMQELYPEQTTLVSLLGGLAAGGGLVAGGRRIFTGRGIATGTAPLVRRVLGPLAGGVSVGKDVYDLFSGGDPGNMGDLGFGLGGAATGLGLAALLGVGGWPLAGAALTGYGVGRLGQAGLSWLRGGSIDPNSAALRAAEARHGLPSGLLSAIMMQESGGDPLAFNQASGAAGAFQFIPPTAKWRGVKDPFDPEESTEKAAEYMRYLLGKTGSLSGALSAYGGDPSGQYAAEVEGRIPEYAGEGEYAARGALHIFIHTAPGVRVTTQGPPGVVVRQVE